MIQHQQNIRSYGPLRELLGFLWPHKKRLIMASIALVLTALAQLSLGYGIQQLIDDGFAAASTEGLKNAIFFMAIVGTAVAFGAFVRFYVVSWLGERVSADLRNAVFANLIKIHPSFYEENHPTEIISRLTTDTTLLQTLIGSSVSLAARSALTLIGALVLMSITNLKLTLIMLIGVPLMLLPIFSLGRRVRKLSNSSQASIASVGNRAGEVLQSIKIVQSFRREETERKIFSTHVSNAFQVAKRRIKQRAFLMACAILLFLLGMIGMMWAGGRDVISGEMSGGDLGAFIFYAVMLGGAFATLSEVWGDLQRAAGAAERLLELLHVDSEISDFGVDQTDSKSSLKFDNVVFAYPSRPEQKAINNLSLEIKAGRTTALVGPSGGGKSTIIELLQRFHNPQKGHIFYGKKSLPKLSLSDWRSKLALVPQDPILFTGDVRYNIAYGRLGATQEEIESAARDAHAHNFIMTLPGGYNAELGSQGVQLSGGQRQRIALARALIKNPEILLLDEATSALDAESEFHVQRALHAATRDRTTLIIAHRLSTIINADFIAVIDQGQVVAAGTHQELLASSPLYSKLASMQFQTKGQTTIEKRKSGIT